MNIITKLFQFITNSYYFKGLPSVLYKVRNFYRTKDEIYQSPENIKFKLNIDNHFQNFIIWGYYEVPVKILFNKYLKNDDIVIDIGANLGFFSLLASKIVGNNGKVVSIEPNPEVFSLLKTNIKINNLKNIIPVEKAATDREGKATFNLGIESAFSTLITNPNFAKIKAAIEVETTTVDNQLHELGINLSDINLVKIDVEGNEYFTLTGMSKLIDVKKAKFIFECNCNALKHNNHSIIDLFNIFDKCGYFIYWINYDTINWVHGKNLTLTLLDNNNISLYVDKNGDAIASPSQLI